MQADQKITVFIPRIDGTAWMGGKLYFDNLVYLVQTYYPSVTFIETDFNHQTFFPTKNTPTVRIKRKISGVNYMDEFRNAVRDHYVQKSGDSIPVFFSNGVIAETGGIHSIFWIPDFQFLHLREHASVKHLQACEEGARDGASKADVVMLSSQDAKKDFLKFLPEYQSKVNVLPFAKKISSSMLEKDPGYVISKYHLPDSFFYISNQFWKHKNHVVVVDALKILNEKGVDCTLVFSGHTHDFRNPHYFDELLLHIAESGLHSRIHILGLIPFADVVSLIRTSVAVINPSKFEGWNTAVEEVKSIGKQLLLSDLPVHVEQAQNEAVFFDPNCPKELADLMLEHLKMNQPIDRKRQELESQKKYQLSEKKFANDFYQLLLAGITVKQ